MLESHYRLRNLLTCHRIEIVYPCVAAFCLWNARSFMYAAFGIVHEVCSGGSASWGFDWTFVVINSRLSLAPSQRLGSHSK